MSNKFYPLTNAQKSIWVADNLYPGTSQAILSATAIIREELDLALMNEAVNIVVKENDALRIRLVNQDGTPQQYFSDFVYKDFDILDFSYEGGEQDYSKWEKITAETPFALIDSELFYFAMVKLGEQKNICFFKFHHTIVDAWGIVLVIRKTLKEYWQLIHGIYPEKEEASSFIDHINDEIKYIASERFNKHKEFWSGTFDTVPEFISFTDNKGFNSLVGKRKSYVLSESLSSKLKYFCDLNNVSGFSVFYALLALYLFKRSNKKDVAIETPILNRSGHTEKNTVGMFMHNIPTRITIEPSLNFISFVTQSFKELMKFMRYQRYPYSSILKDFREKHQFSGTLVDVTLNYHNNKLDSVIEYEGIWNYCGAQTNSLSICVSDRDGIGLPELDYDYLLEVFSEEDIDQMHNQMCNLLTDALENPSKRLSELQMLSQDELTKLLVEFNQTQLPYEAKTVSDLFEDQVIKTPDSTAIVFGDESLTYRELNERANQLARYLRSKGVTRNSIVGLLVSRSLEMVIGILGILKAGAAYLPMDPGYPSERIVYMLNQSHTQLTLTDRENQSIGTAGICEFANISPNNTTVYDYDTANLDTEKANLDDLAYVIYTSGTTGKPKGVMVHHRALCNLISAIANEICLETKTIVSLTTISFDIFFLETIFPLTKGMKIVIANEDEQTIPQLLFNIVAKHNVEVIQTTPSRLKLILDNHHCHEILNSLSYILIGGEALPAPLLSRLKEMTSAEIYNLYGPTETTVWSTMKNVTHSQKITIGKPIANTQIYILNDYFSPVPIGSIGEIFISGDGVSLGYLNNQELTQARFLENPFIPGQKMYRTGDLGRWLNDGEIECLGRNDNQVKIRGFRIELEEIEACLIEHTAVEEAIVAIKEDKVGKKQLCAYLTGETRLSNKDLRAHILKSLPNYMVPASFTWLSTIPLTPNGKIDRHALPDPSEIDFGQTAHSYLAPRNDLEQKLAMLWAEALEVERVGIDDNLFALGGDSLTILEIMSGALAYEWKLNAQDFYESPTIRLLASKITGRNQENDRNEDEIYIASRIIPKEIKMEPVDPGNVLLTGATGFLGNHLLKELLTQTDNIIYCLVRGDQATEKLVELLQFNFSSLPITLENRIVVVNGDISLKQFGLNDNEYNNLAQKVQTVIHSGALVKHYGDYREFEKTNVQGTCEVIRFCLKFDKKLNHISTISVSGDFLVDPVKMDTVFSENDFYVGQDYKANVYIRSKFVAEQYILRAEANGLKAAIFRVGVVTGRYQDGKFQRNIDQNAFYRRIKSIVSLKVIPESFLEQSIEFTPVDYCAKGIVNIIKVNQTSGLVFHIFNHQKVRAIELLSYLRLLDYPVRTLPNLEFDAYIAQLSQTKEGKEKLSGLASDLSVNKRLNHNNTIKVNSIFTINYLSQTGFVWPEIDVDYLTKVLSHMREVGFINNFKRVSG
ncbi:amino acid adenylation domain-containing protein [Desulfitobacterium sp.]|uniref:non-ribosomal peptide synthetase family protein n=1 Tax=Desulfitobacterium sp. TaxID=49981 RepID=UPI002CFA0093|nr:amino acid adenylation domain-containing protein [Desulfitobacterium sp.]HVJ50107.1 amino acid adenylation domain-containing protein [Desulfitobacterium sp.]